jgi:hypothetical protein
MSAVFTHGMILALEFNLRSEPQLELARWLESQAVDVPQVLNMAGPIVEHDIVVFPGATFDFAAPGSADSVRAVVHVAVGEDAETPIDLVAWTRERPDRILRCLGVTQAIGISQLFNPASYFAGRPLRIHRSVLSSAKNAWAVRQVAAHLPRLCRDDHPCQEREFKAKRPRGQNTHPVWNRDRTAVNKPRQFGASLRELGNLC